MTALYITLGTLMFLWVFWLLYVLVMGLYRAYLLGILQGPSLWMGYPVVAVAIAVDLFANWTIATLWFKQLPTRKLELVTDRLSRYITYPSGDYRTTHAQWICVHLLDPIDPTGKHCK